MGNMSFQKGSAPPTLPPVLCARSGQVVLSNHISLILEILSEQIYAKVVEIKLCCCTLF